MRKIVWTAILAMLVAATTANANRAYKVIGPGAKSCGYWTTHISQRDLLISWVMGFASAFNANRALNYPEGSTEHDMTNGADREAIEVWMTTYCNENPLSDIATASLMMILAATSQQ